MAIKFESKNLTIEIEGEDAKIVEELHRNINTSKDSMNIMEILYFIWATMLLVLPKELEIVSIACMLASAIVWVRCWAIHRVSDRKMTEIISTCIETKN